MRIIFFFLSALFFLSCANVMSPTGGPKDEDPPQLISTIPKHGQTDYRGSRVMLEFNEFLKLKNPKDEIIITPDVKDVKYSVKKNIFTIEFNERLQDSTTYSFAFREAIQDLNEGNPAEDLHLAFSTGNQIDSLEISGNVTQLLKGLPAEKYTVAIYQQDTFDIFKHRPSYFTRTDKKGDFKIRNLKAGEYNVYAFEDKNKNLVLESKSEKFGFVKEKVSLQQNTDSVNIVTVPLDARPIMITGIRSLGHFTKVRLNKNLVSYTVASMSPTDKNIPHCFSASQSEVDIFPTKPPTDSTLIRLVGIDSLEQRIDTTFYVKQTTAKSLKDKIKISVSKSQFTDDAQAFYSEIRTTELPKFLVPDSIYVQADSMRRFPFSTADIKFDTIFRKISITKTFDRKDSVQWKQARLTIGNMAFVSILGDSSKSSSHPIALITSEESASLIIESAATEENTLIELLDDRQNSLGIYPHSKSLVIKNIKPGTVLLRRINDVNSNGRWDPGNPNMMIPPEKITFYINPEGKSQIPLRANWEVNIMWNF